MTRLLARRRPCRGRRRRCSRARAAPPRRRPRRPGQPGAAEHRRGARRGPDAVRRRRALGRHDREVLAPLAALRLRPVDRHRRRRQPVVRPRGRGHRPPGPAACVRGGDRRHGHRRLRSRRRRWRRGRRRLPRRPPTPTPTATASPVPTVHAGAAAGRSRRPRSRWWHPREAWFRDGLPVATVAWGERPPITGTLRRPDGRPVSGARLGVTSRLSMRGAVPVAHGSVRTNTRGRFSFTPAAGPSRTFAFAFGDSAVTVELRVRPRITLRVLARRRRQGARGGRAVRRSRRWWTCSRNCAERGARSRRRRSAGGTFALRPRARAAPRPRRDPRRPRLAVRDRHVGGRVTQGPLE